MLWTVYERARDEALKLYEKAGIVLTDKEKENVEIADFGLGDYETTGLACVVYVNTDRCCAKEMALLPGQTCPEHRHAPVSQLGYEGKEETFRCRYGTCHVYIAGEETKERTCRPPQGREQWYTVFHEVVLEAGMQLTLKPDTLHWFQAGEEGAVVSEFSTHSFDEYDIFTDPYIVRVPEIEEV